MHKTILTFLLLLHMGTLSAQTYPSADLQEKMRVECDRFLKNMPADLQHRQSEAVRSALKGDYTALQQVRQGRNAAPALPEGVQAEYLTPTLCRFSPVKRSHEKRPVLLYLHGGGWAFGSINSCTRFCAAVALAANCHVVALNYRLAPEHPFPAPLTDCIEAFRYLKNHADAWGGDTTRISIGGDSAGGNLTLATALSEPSVYSIIPIYPVTKVYTARTESWRKFAVRSGCEAEIMESFNTAYAGAHGHDPRASVALAADSTLQQLPPALFISAGRDILFDQGKEFVERMQKLGLKVEHQVFPTATHLFITVPGQPTAFDQAVYQVSRFLQHRD